MDGIEATRLRSRDNPAGWEKLFLDEAHGGKASPFGPGTLRYDMFRRKFRVPLEVFHEMLDEIRASGLPLFKDEMANNTGSPHPLGLKLLAALRTLATGTPFENQEEGSGIKGETICQFFHAWCKWMVDNKKALWISLPATRDEVSDR